MGREINNQDQLEPHNIAYTNLETMFITSILTYFDQLKLRVISSLSRVENSQVLHIHLSHQHYTQPYQVHSKNIRT